MPESGELRIVAYEPRHAEAFRDLNLAWIEEYFEVEDLDRRQLLDPEASILRPGGAIFVAESPEGVLGVCALVYEAPGRFEVSKMAVRKDVRGRGVGRRLLGEVIAGARRLGAEELSIVSNTVLETALHLYRAFGFVERACPQDDRYARCNVALELRL